MSKLSYQQVAQLSSGVHTCRPLNASCITAVNVEWPSDPARETAPRQISVIRDAKIPPEGHSRPVLTK